MKQVELGHRHRSSVGHRQSSRLGQGTAAGRVVAVQQVRGQQCAAGWVTAPLQVGHVASRHSRDIEQAHMLGGGLHLKLIEVNCRFTKIPYPQNQSIPAPALSDSWRDVGLFEASDNWCGVLVAADPQQVAAFPAELHSWPWY